MNLPITTKATDLLMYQPSGYRDLNKIEISLKSPYRKPHEYPVGDEWFGRVRFGRPASSTPSECFWFYGDTLNGIVRRATSTHKMDN